MRNQIVAAVSALALANVAVMPAFAELQVCNNSPEKVQVAVGYYDQTNWTTIGWYIADPNACVTPLTGELNNNTYYVYAEGYTNKSLYWSGDTNMCVDTVNAFSVRGYSGCESVGYATRQYSKVETAGNTTFTWNLNYSKPSGGDNTMTGVAVAAAVIAAIGLAANESKKADENACMRKCQKSRARCVELCTQR